jgi:mono/diheme cytochrome c family protein
MKKVLRIFGILLAVVVLAVAGVASYVKFALPDVGEASDLKVEITPARLKHGEYLATTQMGCLVCHSSQDKTAFLHPRNGPLGAGKAAMIPGLPAPNLTPVGLKDWTDGEIYRAVTTGVSRDGRALHPIMPYDNYFQADPEDIYSVIAYLRQLSPAGTTYPKPEHEFPFNFIVNTMPKKAEPGKRPDPSDELAYGKYLVQQASCGHCHVQVDERGAPVAGTEFTGGRAFPQENGTVCYTANLTPCPETGLGKWSKADFIARFKSYAAYRNQHVRVPAGEFNTEMPWVTYSDLSEQELGAMYTYLRSLKPVKHKVEHWKKLEPKLVAAR